MQAGSPSTYQPPRRFKMATLHPRHPKTLDQALTDIVQSILEAKALASQGPYIDPFHVECLDVAENAVRLIRYHEVEITRNKNEGRGT